MQLALRRLSYAMNGEQCGTGRDGLDVRALALFCLFWGMGGAFISLQMSR